MKQEDRISAGDARWIVQGQYDEAIFRYVNGDRTVITIPGATEWWITSEVIGEAYIRGLIDEVQMDYYRREAGL